MWSWCFKAKVQKMLEMYELGFHTARFDHRGVPAYSDAYLFIRWDV